MEEREMEGRKESMKTGKGNENITDKASMTVARLMCLSHFGGNA
jgi:hypothetical protein